MSTPVNPFADMMAKMQEQMQDMSKGMPGLDAFSPAAFEAMMGTMPKEMMETMFGNKLDEGALDARTKLLLTLAGLTMQGAQNEVAVRQTVRHAQAAGATEQHITETIGMMAMFAGLPAVTRATELAKQALTDKKTSDNKDDET
ncbi:MAG: carboxymuconolactone decarboxylase family protein [Ascidiaceihabitans sp.]|nr:carboxymuconolactone decarboxylase family protein [Ascidiaceihabitans sp.]